MAEFSRKRAAEDDENVNGKKSATGVDHEWEFESEIYTPCPHGSKKAAPVVLIDGKLAYTWETHPNPEAKKYHGCDVSIIFKAKNLPNFSHYMFDWEGSPGYLYFRPDKSAPPLIRKINDAVTYQGGLSFSGGGNSGRYRTSFDLKDKTMDVDAALAADLLIEMDADGVAAANSQAAACANHPKAFAAFLDRYGAKAFDVTVTSTDVTNKATYVDFLATSAGGSVFKVASRLGGVHMSEGRVLGRLKSDSLPFLRELADLAPRDMFVSCVVKISMEARGDDLTLDADGFEITTAAHAAAGTIKRDKPASRG